MIPLAILFHFTGMAGAVPTAEGESARMEYALSEAESQARSNLQNRETNPPTTTEDRILKQVEQGIANLQAVMNDKTPRIGIELKGDNKILGVVMDSPARKAGILPGDAVLKVNGRDVTSWDSERIVAEIGRGGPRVSLETTRGASSITLTLQKEPFLMPEPAAGIMRTRLKRLSDRVAAFKKKAENQDWSKLEAVVLRQELLDLSQGYLDIADDFRAAYLISAGQSQPQPADPAVVEPLAPVHTVLPLFSKVLSGNELSAPEVDLLLGQFTPSGLADLAKMVELGPREELPQALARVAKMMREEEERRPPLRLDKEFGIVNGETVAFHLRLEPDSDGHRIASYLVRKKIAEDQDRIAAATFETGGGLLFILTRQADGFKIKRLEGIGV